MKTKVTLTAFMIASAFNLSSANELRGDVDVSLTIGQGCAVNGTTAAGVNKFGAVDFGEQSNLALFVDAESAGAAGGDITLTCNSNLAYSIALDNGVHDSSGQRRVSRQGVDFVDYELYQDSSRTIRWGSGSEALSLVGTGAQQPLTIYGRVLAGQATPAAGDYTDTVRMTISW